MEEKYHNMLVGKRLSEGQTFISLSGSISRILFYDVCIQL